MKHQDPANLWNTGGRNSSILATNHGDKGAYVQAFLDAAATMSEQMLANSVPIDITVYPALYLLRHGLELGFKALLYTYDYEHRTTPTPKRFGHDLQKLWGALKPFVEAEEVSGDNESNHHPEMIEYLDKVVATIHKEDPNGEAARYDSNHDGSQTFKNVLVVNTEVLAEMCAIVSEWMTLVLGYRMETVAQLRQGRGE